MEKYIKLKEYSQDTLKKFKINTIEKDNEFIIKQLAFYIDSLIFNIVSIASIIVVFNNSVNITSDTLKIVKEYIENKCSFKYAVLTNKMSGGGDTFMTASYFGVDEPMYNIDNKGSDILGIDFKNNIAREQIGGSGTKLSKMQKIILKYINEIIIYHGLKANKEVKKQLVNIVAFHIRQLFEHLIESNKPLSLAQLNKMIKKTKILCPLQ